jgi:hypothetical protein
MKRPQFVPSFGPFLCQCITREFRLSMLTAIRYICGWSVRTFMMYKTAEAFYSMTIEINKTVKLLTVVVIV